jgi:cytochrome c biogenesis protein CcdA
MGEATNGQNIEVKKLEVKIGGVEVRIEKGEVYISAGSENVEEDKKTGWRSLREAAARQGGMALGVSLILAGMTLFTTHVVPRWESGVYMLVGLVLIWSFLTFSSKSRQQ